MSAVFIGLALFAANGGGLLAMIAYATVVAVSWKNPGLPAHSRLHNCCGGRYPARALIVLTSFARMLLKAEAS